MTLGQKIKTVRLELGLSQRQLCGDTITRNMLSQIEAGKAMPSMATLQILAARLQRPVSFFLEEGPGDSPLTQAREAFRQANYSQALEALADCAEQTEEAVLLEYLCRLELAREAISQGKLPYARQLLEKAGPSRSPYITAPMRQQRQLLYLQAGGDGEIPAQETFLLLKARRALAAEDTASAARYLEACDDRDPLWALLRGTAYFRAGDFSSALDTLKQAENAYPKESLPMLEACCKELEDYKMAYHYACLQR